MQRILIFAFLVVPFCIAAPSLSADNSERPLLMAWSPPPAGNKIGIIDGLDHATLEALTESGVVQYYQPRREKGSWDVIVGAMIHAPVDVVWEVVSDHTGPCRLLSDTYDLCETLPPDGDKIRMHYKVRTSVIKFTFKMDIIDEITEKPPYSWHIETVDGDLKGRELELLLVPAGNDRTMAFLRYYGAAGSIGHLTKAALASFPELESPVYAPAATYHVRSYKNEAEKRAGYVPPKTAPPLDYQKLNPKTLNLLCRWYGGLLRETREGKVIDNMAFAAIDAPPKTVWEVMTDFEHYDRIFPGSHNVVESRTGNEAMLMQKNLVQLSIYVLNFSLDLHARYTLEEPRRMSYVAVDGVYKDTYGDFVLAPFDGGTKTFVFATIKVMLERDKSLAVKIVKSGAFPFESTVNMTFARDMLNKFKLEAERRK